MGAPETYIEPCAKPAKTKYTVTTSADIPSLWPRYQARKNTSVSIRASNGVESFKVDWQDAVLVSDPSLDLIIKGADGLEYPCKKDLFFSTYTLVPAITNDDLLAGYKFVKSAVITLVPVPMNATVTINTLEGVLPVIEYPDYISIGSVGELYANTKDFVDKNLTLLS